MAPIERYSVEWEPTPDELTRFTTAAMVMNVTLTNIMQVPPEVFRELQGFLNWTEIVHAVGRGSSLPVPAVNDIVETFRRVLTPFIAFVDAAHETAEVAFAVTSTPDFEEWSKKMRGER